MHCLCKLSNRFIVRLFTHLFTFGAIKVPSTDLVITCEHVHGHHADSEGDGANDHLPGVGGHQEAVHTEKASQHGAIKLKRNQKVHKGGWVSSE